jgi:hypothetical protein
MKQGVKEHWITWENAPSKEQENTKQCVKKHWPTSEKAKQTKQTKTFTMRTLTKWKLKQKNKVKFKHEFFTFYSS